MNSSFRNISLKKVAIAMAGLIVCHAGFAQEAAPAANTNSESNMMMYVLIATGAILLLGIMLLGNVMLKLAKLIVEKEKGKALLILLLFWGSTIFAQEPAASAANTNTLVFNWDMIAATAVLSMELLTILFMLFMINKMAASLSDKKEEATEPMFHLPKLFDNFNASVAIEKEADILLDHNYDGIRELDNNLPPWWKYGFYLTIVWSFAYMFYYHVYGAPLSEEEYKTEVMEAKAEIDAYMKKSANNVDESNIKLADASGIKEGLEVYTNNCATCHGNNGEGGVGPNMTDAYWIHGGDLASVFKTVKYGWPAKGMKSWQTDLSPVQMKNVASYILSFQGTNPANPKAAEGELYRPNEAIDSTATAKVDTVLVK